MDHKPIEEYKLKLKNLSLEPNLDFKRIKCPSCNSIVPADNINDKIGKCSSCDIVFPFHKSISELLSTNKPKQEVIKPEGIDIFEYQDEKEFSIHQPFTAFDIIPLVIMMLITFILSVESSSLIAPIISLLLTMFPLYNLIQRKHHKVYLTIDQDFLHIKWRPKKWKKDKKFAKDEVNQIYIKSHAGHNAIYMIINGNDGQKHIKLMGEILSLSKARYLEQEIEKYLGIEDREVPEETK